MPYKSDAKDKQRGLLLGIFYVALAIGLGYMLIKIWPPVPWPDPNIAKYRESISQSLAGCGVVLAPWPDSSVSPKPSELASSRGFSRWSAQLTNHEPRRYEFAGVRAVS